MSGCVYFSNHISIPNSNLVQEFLFVSKNVFYVKIFINRWFWLCLRIFLKGFLIKLTRTYFSEWLSSWSGWLFWSVSFTLRCNKWKSSIYRDAAIFSYLLSKTFSFLEICICKSLKMILYSLNIYKFVLNYVLKIKQLIY